MFFGAGAIINPVTIETSPQNLVNASIDLAHIPVNLGRTDFTISVYGKNLLNKHYDLDATPFAISPPGYIFATGYFSRPRVIGVNLTVKF
jgi:outer membrane receptor protein involved in Fe transport